MDALRIAATGMDAQQTRVAVISNNIANMSTTAYNTRRAEFSDLLYQQNQPAGAVNAETGVLLPAGVQIGVGVRPSAVSMSVEQGSLKATGGDLDIAIEGRGYFEIELPSGESAFSRDGTFKRSAEGLIVNSEGFPLAANITIPQDARNITINPDGEIYAYFDDQPQGQLIGVFDIITFVNESGLEAIGSNMFRETAASGVPIIGDAGLEGRGTLRQGYLEQSSVDVVEQIADLIEAQRGYELNSRVVSAADQMLSAMAQLR
ncbi:MAG: flagellar basal-body rod protein FlgG [Pseudomonadota bacterium]